MRDQFSLLTHPRILMAFFIPSLGFGATYAVYTYLVPILKGMEAPSQFNQFDLVWLRIYFHFQQHTRW